ncbi:hypothetical protein SALB1_3028 [Salinisphaera sp. LB1]|nr:hypothetical protein SALB1_3028 [Salinisphaera sp. LB1]
MQFRPSYRTATGPGAPSQLPASEPAATGSQSPIWGHIHPCAKHPPARTSPWNAC